ncbi:MAG: Rne/Rng family ribonuclease, partial [Nitrospinae bacterium]|nr:Rne/Rng family ribonuclease [Nitrospinota bacterium]
YIKSPTTVCYEIIRAIQRIGGNNLGKRTITAETHGTIYDLLIEEENAYLEEMERKYNIEIVLVVNPKLHQEKYAIAVT